MRAVCASAVAEARSSRPKTRTVAVERPGRAGRRERSRSRARAGAAERVCRARPDGLGASDGRAETGAAKNSGGAVELRQEPTLGSARLGSARLGSARLGSARLGSARLGSARLGSALIMRANGPGRFCQVFLRVIHNFSPSVPFRAGNRAPSHTSRKKWSIRTGHHRHRKTSFRPLGPGRSGALKRLVFLCLCPCRLGLSRRRLRCFPVLY